MKPRSNAEMHQMHQSLGFDLTLMKSCMKLNVAITYCNYLHHNLIPRGILLNCDI
jgi:hypothetical protein